MSTSQVPGYVAANNDHLHEGCWAERGTRLLFIDRIENGVVSYSEHDLGVVTAVPCVNMMTVEGFGAAYSDAGWTWHDKSPRPMVPAAAPRHEHVPSVVH